MKKREKNNIKNNNNFGEIIIYKGVDGAPSIEVRMQGETAWLTQKQLAELFGTTKQNISQHVENILKDGELAENSVVKKILTTANVHERLDCPA
jgi:hypothetical protein